MSNKKEYEVGYGKPPKATQFKPGQSGNPKGRPKGSKNLVTDLSEELSEKIIVTEGGKQIKITKQRAMIKSLLAKALKGDGTAAGTLLKLIPSAEQADLASEQAEIMSKSDAEILAAFKAQMTSDTETPS